MIPTNVARGSPCLECGDRHEACWSGCERYKAWRSQINKHISAAKEEKKKRDLFHEVRLAGMKRAGKKRWEK